MPTDPVAIYGAVVATGVAAWNVYKWWRSERFRLAGSVTANMVMTGVAFVRGAEGKRYVSLNVDNRGGVACEVRSFHVLVYKNRLDALRGKLHKGAIVIDPLQEYTNHKLPKRLEPGGSYWGLCEQTAELEEWSRTKRVYLGIAHSMGKRPFRVRLAPIEKAD